MTDQVRWYQDGLRFECTQCGACCTGAPGVVWVRADEIENIASSLGITAEEVRRLYTRRVGRRVSLTERENGDCTFFDPKTRRCTVYKARPAQCRTWPFWNSNLESPDAWREMQKSCPGAGQGQLYQLADIRRQASVVDV